MKSCFPAPLVAASPALSACGNGEQTTGEAKGGDEIAPMEGGGSCPSPSASSAAETLVTDPAVSAAEKLAPGPQLPGPAGKGRVAASPSSAPAARTPGRDTEVDR